MILWNLRISGLPKTEAKTEKEGENNIRVRVPGDETSRAPSLRLFAFLHHISDPEPPELRLDSPVKPVPPTLDPTEETMPSCWRNEQVRGRGRARKGEMSEPDRSRSVCWRWGHR